MPTGVTAGEISICLPAVPTTLCWRRVNVAKCPKWGRGIGRALLAVPDLCFQQVLVLYALRSAHWGHDALCWGAWLGGLGCPGAFSRDPERYYVEKRESCHQFSHPSVPGEVFVETRNHAFKPKL